MKVTVCFKVRCICWWLFVRRTSPLLILLLLFLSHWGPVHSLLLLAAKCPHVQPDDRVIEHPAQTALLSNPPTGCREDKEKKDEGERLRVVWGGRWGCLIE